MSMPNFPDVPDGYTINDSIAQVITSIAMEEIGLSHIINAEGEKLQYTLGTLEGQQPAEPPTFEQILEINESVKDMLGQISFSQMFLMGKMQAALNAYQDSQTPEPPPAPADYNILAAAGIGADPHQFNVDTLPLPFAPAFLKVGDYVSQTVAAPYGFIINETGDYQINYQVAAYTDDGYIPSDGFIAELTSVNEGVLDAIILSQIRVVGQHSTTVHLLAGDAIALTLHLQQIGEIAADSQAISFIKVS